MKDLFRIAIVVCIMGVLCASGVRAKDGIRLTNGEWKPYLSENLKNYGFSSHVVTKAFEKKGIEVEYGFFPWKRSFELAKMGKWEGSVVWAHGDNREEFFYYSDEPVMINRRVLFYLKDKEFDWNALEDLRGIKMGVCRGYTYGELYEKGKAEKVFTVDAANTELQNFKKLLKGRVDVFVANMDVGLKVIKEELSQEEAERITHHPKPIGESGNHLILSKAVDGNEKMMELFNEGFEELKASGEFDQMLADFRDGKYE